MIDPRFEDFIMAKKETFLTARDDLALFIDTHNVEHVMLLLASVGYSRVPVVTKENVYTGTIAISDIMRYQSKQQLTNQAMAQIDIAPMVNPHIATLGEDYTITELMHKIVDAPFLPVLDAHDVLLGIITRKSVLKVMNALLHDFDKKEKEKHI